MSHPTPAEHPFAGSFPDSFTRLLAQVPEPGSHGGDAELVARALGFDRDDLLDLSVTLNPFAPDVRALARGHLDALCHYPDPEHATAMLASTLGVETSRLVLTNGGAEAIALVSGQLSCASVLEPEFSLWARHLDQIAPGLGRVRSNPNNPTGVLAGPDEVALCWDEAFYGLSTGRWTRGDGEKGAWVVGSLTKLYACPGLRLGYVIAPDEERARQLAERQPRWAVNALALALVPELLERSDLESWSSELAHLRGLLVSLLTVFGLDARAGEAPWVLVHDAPFLRAGLAVKKVLVRDCTSFAMPGTQRIAVPSPEGLGALEAALGALYGADR